MNETKDPYKAHLQETLIVSIRADFQQGMESVSLFNPIGTVDGYSISLRDATGPLGKWRV